MNYLTNIIEFIFSLALFFNALLFIPQALKIFKTKASKNISLLTFSGFLLIQLTTVLYGIIKHDHFLIFGYLFSMITCGLVIVLAFIYKNRVKVFDDNHINLEEILNQLPGHIYWKDVNGVCLGANKNNWMDFGCKELSDFVGKTDYELFPKEEADRLRVIDREVMDSGKLQIAEEEVTTIGGKKTLYLSHKVPLKNKLGKTIGILGTSVDITSAKKETLDRLEMLENIIALMPGHVYWIDKNGVYQGCNDNQAKSIGLASRKEIIDKRNIDMPGFLIPEVLDPINEEVMRTGRTITAEEPATLLDGTPAIYFSTKTPLFNHDNETMGMVGISIDITDRKKVEELQKHKEQAEKIREITEQVAHDIRSPLTSLNMIIKKLGTVDEETRTVIRNATNRINDIANNLVIKYRKGDEVNLANAGSNLTPEIISCVVDSLLSEKRTQFIDTNIIFDLNIADDAYGIFAKINSEKFKRVFSNIINNAVESIANAKRAQGLIIVRICKGYCDLDDPENLSKLKHIDTSNTICIQIRDNGLGIPPEVMAKIGVDKISTKSEVGHGIGLYTAIQQIKEWGGDYLIETKPESGTTFNMYLPQVTAPEWFQENLLLQPRSIIVILDDDQSIHDIWEAKFKQFAGKFKLKHYTNPEVMLNEINTFEGNNTIYLIDFELLGSKHNGLEVIRELGTSDRVFSLPVAMKMKILKMNARI